jgi:predicted HAD superfamily Cof-like phosphohydrolase
VKRALELVGLFQQKLGLEAASEPSPISTKQLIDRHHLLTEELSEYLQAGDSGNVAEILDALCDLQYLLLGTVRLHGLEQIFPAAFLRVHKANMEKTPGVNSKRKLVSSDVVKPDGWHPADFSDLLK